MAYNDLTFFTNEPERDLYSRLNTILTNNTQFFDVLVGYFRTSGFFKLYPAMSDIEKIRFPINDEVHSIFNELKDYSVKKVKDEVSEKLHKRIDKIIFDFFGLAEQQRYNIVQSLLSVVEARTTKATKI